MAKNNTKVSKKDLMMVLNATMNHFVENGISYRTSPVVEHPKLSNGVMIFIPDTAFIDGVFVDLEIEDHKPEATPA